MATAWFAMSVVSALQWCSWLVLSFGLSAAQDFSGIVLLQVTAHIEKSPQAWAKKRRRKQHVSLPEVDMPLDIESVTPPDVSTLGGNEVIIKVTGASNKSPGECVVDASSNGWSSVFRETAQAVRSGPDSFSCQMPRLMDEGLVSLTLTFSDGTSATTTVNYVSPLAASFSDIPFFGAKEATLLVHTNVLGSLASDGLFEVHITSSCLKGARASGLVFPVNASRRQKIQIPFESPQARCHEEVTVDLRSQGRSIAQNTVKLIQVPDARRGQVAVDAKRRGLKVDGRPFMPISWFVSLEHGMQAALLALRDTAERGANSVMVYNIIPPRENSKSRGVTEPVARTVLDTAAMLGIKVHVYLLDLADRLTDCYGCDPSKEDGERSDEWQYLADVVTALREHPAILSWYVADDMSGTELPLVYKFIKDLDPYHLISVSVAFPRDANRDQYVRGADIVMAENYPIDGDASYRLMDVVNHWPTRFMPALSCGRAWSQEEDGAIISRAMFRTQFYHSLIAGATGEIWFRYHNPRGWNNPGMPLLEVSSDLSRELLEIVPSVLTAGDWDEETAMPPVKVSARHQDGSLASSKEDMRGRAFRESSGCVTLLVANGRNEPMQAVVQFAPGSPGIFDDTTKYTEAIFPFEMSSMEGRRVSVCNGSLSEWLPAWGVQAFRFNGTSRCAASMPPAWPRKLRVFMQEHGVGIDHSSSSSRNENLLVNPSFEVYSTFAAVPDGWKCRMGETQKELPDASCFADTTVAHDGRHSGRFVTGANPFQFRMQPSTWMNAESLEGKLESGTYSGSVWATADGPMDLIAVHLRPTSLGDHEEVLAQIPLTSEWKRLEFNFTVEEKVRSQKDSPAPHAVGVEVAFKVTQPGVVWLDDAELHRNNYGKA